MESLSYQIVKRADRELLAQHITKVAARVACAIRFSGLITLSTYKYKDMSRTSQNSVACMQVMPVKISSYTDCVVHVLLLCWLLLMPCMTRAVLKICAQEHPSMWVIYQWPSEVQWHLELQPVE